MVLVFVGLALVSSIAAARCATCSTSRLARLGAVFYALLALGLVLLGERLVTVGAVHVAAGVHVLLLGKLVLTRRFCAFCLLAATGAIGGAAFTFEESVAAIAPATIGGLLLAGPTLRALGDFLHRRSIERLLPDEAPPSSGARLVAYVNKECGACRELEATLPSLVAEFGERLSVVLRPAKDVLPFAPVIVVTGAARTVVPGVPYSGELRAAIARALS